jgi:LPS-assembly protein
MRVRHPSTLRIALLLGLLGAVGPAPRATAQLGPARSLPVEPIHRDQPAYYQADTATYDSDGGIVTLTGHVEFWQNDRVLLADKVTFDRNTNVAAAYGHVVLLEPDGQTLFSNYAELTGGMKEGVLKGITSLLAANGRLAANGGRRTSGEINELSRAVYSTCNLCAKDPTRPPLWQIRARSAVQDTQNKMIEYRDAEIEIYGVPVLWLPYLTHPDPSAKRASGLLVPSIGYSKYLSAFTEIPYYWVIDPQSDATITSVLGTGDGPAELVQYRRRFNDGTITINASIADQWAKDPNHIPQGMHAGAHIFSTGQFAIDDTWRWGFDLNRASSIEYLRDFHIAESQSILTSDIYLEGFGQGSYSRLDARAYQGLDETTTTAKLPIVLPRYQYSFVGQPNLAGGSLRLDAGAFNVLRYQGTSTQRTNLSVGWDRPLTGRLGDIWKFTLQVDSAAYVAHGFNEQPNYGSTGNVEAAQAMPTAAVELHWPLARNAGSWGSQIIEPIVQLIAAPNGNSYANTTIPNEDSLDMQFTDSNLFALNRFAGVDRLEGGMRANVALHGAWDMPSGASIDALVGQAYRLQKDDAFPANSGLRNTASDIVGHLSYTPNQYLDLTTQERIDNRTMALHFADALVSTGPSWLRLNTGYIYSTYDPFALYDQPPSVPPAPELPLHEISLGVSTKLGDWKLNASGVRDLQESKMVSLGAGASYENECFIFDVSFGRRYTSINNDHGATFMLFQITLKTVGEFGFNAL